jgi:hypothetical protein
MAEGFECAHPYKSHKGTEWEESARQMGCWTSIFHEITTKGYKSGTGPHAALT